MSFEQCWIPTIQSPPIHMNYSNPQQHVPEAERNNGVIKERVCTCYHCLPYVHLSITLTKYMVIECTKKLNYFPVHNGVSKYYSPQMIFHQKNINFDKNCKYVFGEYVQAHDEPTNSNTNEACSLDCIYLRPVSSSQGGHELWNLTTNSVLIHHRITSILITQGVIIWFICLQIR